MIVGVVVRGGQSRATSASGPASAKQGDGHPAARQMRRHHPHSFSDSNYSSIDEPYFNLCKYGVCRHRRRLVAAERLARLRRAGSPVGFRLPSGPTGRGRGWVFAPLRLDGKMPSPHIRRKPGRHAALRIVTCCKGPKPDAAAKGHGTGLLRKRLNNG